MNKRQKLVQEQFLNNEEAVIRRLKQVYGQSLKDINSKISNLDSSIAMLQKAYNSIDGDEIGDLARAVLGSKKNFTPEEAQETLQSMIQSKVYQKKYQKALQAQVGGVLDTMHKEEFKTVSEYLQKCYEDGFIGTMFDLQGQGIPLCFPLDQESVVRAVQLDSKISHGLYTRLGEDIAVLKKKILAQVSRGIATGMTFQQVAQQLAATSNTGYFNAIRIARTEGHRIQVQAGMDACYKAKDMGADVVKQWDSTLDDRTRESHVAVDGEIRELDKPFSNGLMFPGDPDGAAAEVINCRCALLQRARWALDEDELETLKERAEFFGFDKTEQFEDFKKKYLKAVEEPEPELVKPTFTPAKTVEEAEEYGRRFIVDKTWIRNGNLSYRGLSLESANKLNETLTELYDQFEVPKMQNIQPMPFREARWKKHKDAVLAYDSVSMNSGGLFFNPNFIKTQKKVSEYVSAGKHAYDVCVRNMHRLSGEKLKLVETHAMAGRSLVVHDAEDYLKAFIQHECGHHIHKRVMIYDESAVEIIRQGFEKYAIGISGYATNSEGEYVAESFCAFLNGETDRIDPKMKEYFEGLMK